MKRCALSLLAGCKLLRGFLIHVAFLGALRHQPICSECCPAKVQVLDFEHFAMWYATSEARTV